MVFTVWAFSTTQTLGAEPTCPCSPRDVTLATAMVSAGFPPANGRMEATICDTHPISLPPSPNLPPSPVLEARAVSGVEPTPFMEIFADIAVRDGVGSCDWEAFGGVQPTPFMDRAEAWSCIRELAAACRALGY